MPLPSLTLCKLTSRAEHLAIINDVCFMVVVRREKRPYREENSSICRDVCTSN